MKTLDLEYINNLLPNITIHHDETDKAIKEKAERLLYLMSLLEGEYISAEIIAIPLEEWDIEEDIFALNDKSTPIAEYIINSQETRDQYHHCIACFRAAPLPEPKEFV